jgi:hypothetical protein
MGADTLLPRGRGFALRGRGDAMPFENVPPGLVTDGVPEVGQGADDPVIAPRAIFLGHAYDQGLQLWVNGGTAWRLALCGAIKRLGHELPVPAKNRGGLDDRGHFFQRLPAELLADVRSCLALAIAQAYTPFDLVAKHAIFGHEILMAYQQFLIDSSSDRRQQMFPVHRLPPQLLPSLLTLSMGTREAEDKPKHRLW